MTSSVVKIVEPSVISDTKSYWAMHFCSVIETLYEHQYLEFNIQKSIPYSQPKTLANFVGATETGFFARMRESLQNWGLQYFLCHYLASNDGFNVFRKLIEEISNNYNFDLLRNYHSYGVFVCGIDSYSGANFLRNTKAGILGYTDKTIHNVWEDIKFVDLCILIRRFAGDTLDTALLGEVEGNKGNRLLGSGWGKKSTMCLFGIGVKQGEKNISIQNIKLEGSVKTIAILGSEHSVIDDFHAAIGLMEVFLSLNPQHKVVNIPGQSEIIEIIRSNWFHPVETLIETLRSFINRVDSAGIGINPISIQSVPKIIT
ncbi:hypothetical protein [Vibrio harveyi]|uniref:hypothetical protein n=1 Tax=Vibrio harveyi TaxID=669 RepID=UPI001959BF97|nr:hypothetical protein [Vibrio harveyi]